MEFILDEAEETSCESDDFSDGNSVGETNSFAVLTETTPDYHCHRH
jgi:hypothetical protein